MEDERMERIAKLIKALANPLRLKIVFLLIHHGPMSVSDIVEKTKEAQSLISHHLSILREAGILRVEEKGRFRYYSIDRERLRRIFAEMMLGFFDKNSRRRILRFILEALSGKVRDEVEGDGEERGED